LRDEAQGEFMPVPAIPPDNYLERIAKYVPVEVLAFSVFINAILDQAMRSGGSTPVMVGVPVITIAIVALIAGMAAAPFFVWYIHNEGDAWVTNAIVCFFAFPFWSYALGAVAFTGYRDGNLAAILLATFTVVSGTIKPSMPKPRQVVEARDAARKEGPRLVDLNSPMNVPGNGMPYVELVVATVVFRMPYCLMTADPASDSSGNEMPRRAAISASTGTGS
jgi:hypothetical protein